MKCIACNTDLIAEDYKGLSLHKCPECGNIWLKKDTLRQFTDKTDQFLSHIDVDLWKHDARHKVTKAGTQCPSCEAELYLLDYQGSHIVIPICFSCESVWLSEENRQKLFSYLDQLLSSETITEYMKEIGHDAMEVIRGKESLHDELHDLKTILILIEYRVFSKLPVLERIISDFPK